VEGAARAAAFHQTAILIDDHPLPTHDETAWRAAKAAFRAAPGSDVYRREAVRRSVFRTAYVQLPRSLGNLFLYVALVMLQWGKRAKPLLFVLGPLTVPLLIPGVLCHAFTNGLVLPVSRLLDGRLGRRMLEAPEDESLVDDLERAVELAPPKTEEVEET